ncbi:hypothetical protein BJ684DRAFT_15203 [Piptocephalis cylindrospora]|uniref:Uncharacterized protein n=1 Tax=Piptocephalis cylindrospora TaxID=1907219 RepID=A0A4P9Y6Q4_9FUNG|nr:hypothetical protein BJ684DRAFT_15203 [Piptocephalis cylindrospora]|eukprot:RKP14482.1 hypothetical protein BJ684DRAFT_15203 [Piptocephalis cylindrospora]
MHFPTSLLLLAITALDFSNTAGAQDATPTAFRYYSDIKVPTFKGFGNTRFYSATMGQYMVQMPKSNVLGALSSQSPISLNDGNASSILSVTNQVRSNYVNQVHLTTNANGANSCLTYTKSSSTGAIQSTKCSKNTTPSQSWIVRYALASEQVVGWTFSPKGEQSCLAPATANITAHPTKFITPLVLTNCNSLEAIWASESVGAIKRP